MDLAGVDTVGNTTCIDKNFKEIGMANCTKTCMEQFLLLTQNKTNINRIWFKLHPLIYYLKEDLQTNSILRLLQFVF